METSSLISFPRPGELDVDQELDKSETIELFVPGRLCLLGEHSDWAGEYKRADNDIQPGRCIVCGSQQGLHARVRRLHSSKSAPSHSESEDEDAIEDPMELRPLDKVRIISHDEAGYRYEHIFDLEPEYLLSLAREGGFWSYAAGTIYQVMIHHMVGGIEIDNYHTDLPLKKGLSSSAAMCVLVARAFNQLFSLKLTVRGEMELAFKGERVSPSMCGRMDQCCAFGANPTLMTFDGDVLHTSPVQVKGSFYFVVVDLHASKNTQEILSSLSHGYPFPHEDTAHYEIQLGVRRFLGELNSEFVERAMDALQAGDPPSFGRIMVEYQEAFDRYLIPACPTQLTAPVLHATIKHPTLQPHIFGAKGIGSQGDGSVQFLCRSEQAQAEVFRIAEEELQMTPFKFNIHS